jgi:hypothetical protein
MVGAGFGVILSWWLYNLQKRTSTQQDYILQRIRELEEKNTQVLVKLENFAEQSNQLLAKLIAIDESIFELDKKIQSCKWNPSLYTGATLPIIFAYPKNYGSFILSDYHQE